MIRIYNYRSIEATVRHPVILRDRTLYLDSVWQLNMYNDLGRTSSLEYLESIHSVYTLRGIQVQMIEMFTATTKADYGYE